MRVLPWIMFAMLLPTAANAVCSDRSTLVGKLANTYKEAPVAQAITADGKLLEVLSSESGNTWTVLITQPNGTACALAEGKFWHTVEADREEDDEPPLY